MGCSTDSFYKGVTVLNPTSNKNCREKKGNYKSVYLNNIDTKILSNFSKLNPTGKKRHYDQVGNYTGYTKIVQH